MNLGLILTEKSEHDTSGKRLILFVKEIDQVLMKTFHSFLIIFIIIIGSIIHNYEHLTLFSCSSIACKTLEP